MGKFMGIVKITMFTLALLGGAYASSSTFSSSLDGSEGGFTTASTLGSTLGSTFDLYEYTKNNTNGENKKVKKSNRTVKHRVEKNTTNNTAKLNLNNKNSSDSSDNLLQPRDFFSIENYENHEFYNSYEGTYEKKLVENEIKFWEDVHEILGTNESDVTELDSSSMNLSFDEIKFWEDVHEILGTNESDVTELDSSSMNKKNSLSLVVPPISVLRFMKAYGLSDVHKSPIGGSYGLEVFSPSATQLESNEH
jgi:hypothetical protein